MTRLVLQPVLVDDDLFVNNLWSDEKFIIIRGIPCYICTMVLNVWQGSISCLIRLLYDGLLTTWSFPIGPTVPGAVARSSRSWILKDVRVLKSKKKSERSFRSSALGGVDQTTKWSISLW